MTKGILILASLFFLLGTPGLLAHEGGMDSSQPLSLSGESIYNLDTTWSDQNGKVTKLSELQGKPVVIAMVYTSCQGACPLTISDLKRIDNGLPEPERKQVRFAVFSFDTSRDTPPKLKKFAKAHELDLSRWTLFHGSTSAVRKLAAVLGIRYKRDKNGDFDHSNVITIIDSGGVIRYQQFGLRKDPKEAVAKLHTLLEKASH